jgi:hypothetical protein
MSARQRTPRIERRWRRSVEFTTVASLLGLAACAKLIGIEEVQLDPSFAGTPGAAGSAVAGQSASGGHANSAGGGTAATSNGGQSTSNGGQSTSNGGQSTSSGGTGTQGGDGNRGGNSAAAGASGGFAGASSTVKGHVIDFWGHSLSNVSVEVAGKASSTDAQGAFSFDSIPTEYDASLVVTYNVNGRIKTRAWVYQGLTRRDPTLQIYEGLSDRGTQVDVLPNNPSTLTGSRTLSISFGGPDGADQKTDVSGGGISAAHLAWQGPQVTQEFAHALIWEPDPNSDFPAQFIAFDTTQVGLTDTSDVVQAHGSASFNLSADTIPSGTIVGTVPGSGFMARFNNVFLRYTSNAVIKLLADKSKTAGFSYLIPSIPDSSATLVAGEGDAYTELGVTHKDGLVPNTAGLSLSIPTPARDLAVTPNTDLNKVSATTQFSFKPGGSANAPFVATFTYEDNSVHDDILYVVSAKAPFKLPKVVNGTYTLPAGGPYIWRIETHGAPASVDAMAGPSGFLDALSNSYNCDEPSGPRTGDGFYTLSKPTKLQLAP